MNLVCGILAKQNNDDDMYLLATMRKSLASMSSS